MNDRGSWRDPARRGLLVVAATVSVLTVLWDRPGPATDLVSLLASARFPDIGLMACAGAGAVVGAQARARGLVRARWCAGEDRVGIVVCLIRDGVRRAAWIPPLWWSADIATSVLRFGSPTGLGSSALLVRTLVFGAAAAGFGGAIGALVGLAVGSPPRALGVVAALSLPFSSESLGLIPPVRGWWAALSPLSALRTVLLSGTGSELTGLETDPRLATRLAIATFAWCVVLVAIALRADPGPRDAHRRGSIAPALAVTALLAIGTGAVVPSTRAAQVPWQLRPRWRDAVAHGRSSLDRTRAWLACRQRATASCRALEAGAGLQLPVSSARILARATAFDLPPDRFLISPASVPVRVTVPPQRSGRVVVRTASLTLHLIDDHRRGWLVDAATPVRARAS